MNVKGGRAEKFGAAASFLYRRLAEPALAPMHRRIADEIPVDRGRLLDVGCGPGALTRRIAERRSELAVIGLDVSEGMIRQATRGPNPPNVAFRAGSPTSAALSDEIDFALSVLSFHHWEEPATELAAIHRALKRGGRLWLYEPDAEASDTDLRADRAPLLGWLRIPPAWQRRMSHGHGFSASEIEHAVRPTVAGTSFRAISASRSGSCWRLELQK
jgi:SAM-dependent methyltransferase